MRLLFVLLLLLSSCAHRQVAEEVQAPPPAPTPAPEVKTKIKYVYVKTPDTTSAMTVEPYERSSEKPAKTLTEQIVQLFWPLLTLLAAGALMIVGLYVEHLILNRQLAKRAQLRAQAS